MMDLTLGQLIDLAGRWVLIFSLLHSILPPIEFFADFPMFQRWYSLLIRLVGYFGSLNLRGTLMKLYPSYKNGNGNASPTTKP